MASRVLGAFAVAATATIASLALATPASAHTPVSSAECVKDKAVLSVKLTQYAGGNKNTVLIKDGDKVLVDEKFGENWPEKVGNKVESKKFEADGTVAHKFTIKVTASDGSNHNYEKTHETAACVQAPPTKSSETKPPVPSSSVSEAPSSSVPPVTTSASPVAPGGSAPEPPLAATGASPMWLLLSGLGLVGAGAGTLLFLRRRRTA
ncbi:LPXTG cell wall anchor domain-containing protein [Lentzea sp.]|uniref:LPXTG cell wall anchor domain-containing protein n=1 Tax=Lentzea sp. TaxID=56099 RepID=UPI002ED60556